MFLNNLFGFCVKKMNWKKNKNETGASWEVVAVVDVRAQFPWFHPLAGTRVVAM